MSSLLVPRPVIQAARRLRHKLHENPYVSNDEKWTADTIVDFLRSGGCVDGVPGIEPIRTGVGGHGLVYEIKTDRRNHGYCRQDSSSSSSSSGDGGRCHSGDMSKSSAYRTILLRSDMDALPLLESASPSRSRKPRREAPVSCRPGAHHACGHDGHVSMLSAALLHLNANRDRFLQGGGRVLAVFQPAEETGEGAKRMIADLGSDMLSSVTHGAFGMHNIPGEPEGKVLARAGLSARASTGIEITITGAAAHASEPHRGLSPLPVLARVAEKAPELPATVISLEEGERGEEELDAAEEKNIIIHRPPPSPPLLTLVHLSAGKPGDFGVLPAVGTLCATLRADRIQTVNCLTNALLNLVAEEARAAAGGEEFQIDHRLVEPFAETINSKFGFGVVKAACAELKDHVYARSSGKDGERTARLSFSGESTEPFPWSEDFGQFTAACGGNGALFGLGAGLNHPALHAKDYDFNDDLIPMGADLWLMIVQNALHQHQP